jgi:hypothetical protein
MKERDHRVDRLQAMLEGGPLRLKPVPPNWGNRRLDRRIRLTWALPPRINTGFSEDSVLVYTAACTKRSANPTAQAHVPPPCLMSHAPLDLVIPALG